jgi:hypothetical protein
MAEEVPEGKQRICFENGGKLIPICFVFHSCLNSDVWSPFSEEIGRSLFAYSATAFVFKCTRHLSSFHD